MADTHDLEAEIRDILELTQGGAFEPDTPWYLRLATWACELGDAVHAVALTIEAGEVEKFRQPLVMAAYKLWDDVIVPFDVPNVPEFIETYVESAIRPTIPAVVDEALSRIPK